MTTSQFYAYCIVVTQTILVFKTKLKFCINYSNDYFSLILSTTYMLCSKFCQHSILSMSICLIWTLLVGFKVSIIHMFNRKPLVNSGNWLFLKDLNLEGCYTPMLDPGEALLSPNFLTKSDRIIILLHIYTDTNIPR